MNEERLPRDRRVLPPVRLIPEKPRLSVKTDSTAHGDNHYSLLSHPIPQRFHPSALSSGQSSLSARSAKERIVCQSLSERWTATFCFKFETAMTLKTRESDNQTGLLLVHNSP